MIRTLAGLTTLAALVAACDASTRTGPSAGVPDTPAAETGPISLTPTVVVAGSPVTFTSTGLFDFEAYSRHWDFGDGTTADAYSASHVYQNAGAYDVRLVGSDGVTTRTAAIEVNVMPAGAGTLPPPEEVRKP
jgi:PKD repeat protein